MNGSYKLWLLGTAVLFAPATVSAQVAATTLAQAQTTGVSDETSGIGDIIVTAQRREESLQRTPVSVAVLTGDVLAKQAIVSEQDLRVNAAGLTVRATGGSNQLNYAIRGESLDAYSDTRPGVLPYFNEVQVAGDTGSSAFYDLQSVQVLKGPQGTLFGRSATGGAVLFTSQRPTNDLGGYVSGGIGNYKLRKVEGAINLPLVTDQLLARFAGFYQRRDGYQNNLFDGRNVGGFERFGLRGSLTFKIGDKFRNDLVVDYSKFDGQSMGGVVSSLKPDAQTPAASALLYSPALDTIFGFPGAFAAIRAANPGGSPDGLAGDLALQKARGPYEANFNYDPLFKSRNVIVTNISTFELADNLQLKNVFGYAHSAITRQIDVDGTVYTIDHTFNTSKTDQVSEELQLIGTALGDRLKYVVGGFYSFEKTPTLIRANLLDLSPLSPANLVVYDYTKRNTTYAAYAQGTYDLSDVVGLAGLGFTAGLRYTTEKARITLNPDHGSFGCVVTGCGGQPASAFANDQSVKSKNLSWTIGLQEQVNSNLLLYAASRRAFKAAGFNGILAPLVGLGDVGGNGYAAQRVTDAEIGMKYQGRVANIPVRFNIAAYQSWIVNSQRAAFTFVLGGPAAITVNVPKAKVKGFELEAVIRPADWLSLGGTFAYTNGKFTDNIVSVQGQATLFGPAYPDTPKKAGSVFAEVTVPITGRVNVVGRGDYYAQSRTNFTSTIQGNPEAFFPGYGIANFRLGIEDVESGWSLTGYVKNAFNKTYYVGGVATAELIQINTAVPGDPRTFMAEARLKF